MPSDLNRPRRFCQDEDVAVRGELLPVVWYPVGAVLLGVFVEVLLGENAVGGAGEQDGQGFRLIGFGDDYGLEVYYRRAWGS